MIYGISYTVKYLEDLLYIIYGKCLTMMASQKQEYSLHCLPRTDSTHFQIRFQCRIRNLRQFGFWRALNFIRGYKIDSDCSATSMLVTDFTNVNSHTTNWSRRTSATSDMKNVSRDSLWNLILNILVISAQTGNEILKTAFTGNWNQKWKFDFVFHDLLLWAINLVLMRDPTTW